MEKREIESRTRNPGYDAALEKLFKADAALQKCAQNMGVAVPVSAAASASLSTNTGDSWDEF